MSIAKAPTQLHSQSFVGVCGSNDDTMMDGAHCLGCGARRPAAPHNSRHRDPRRIEHDCICDECGNEWTAGVTMIKAIQQHATISHRFAIGAMVRLNRSDPIPNAVPGLYEVLGNLPERDGELQYRIKSLREPYQRIIKESELDQA